MADSFSTRYAPRLVFVLRALVLPLALWSLLRLVVYAVLGAQSAGLAQLVTVMSTGALFDVMTGLTVLMPLVLKCPGRSRDDATALCGESRKRDTFIEADDDCPSHRDLASDAAAIFQTAYQIYRDGEFRLPDVPTVRSNVQEPH